MSQWIIQNARVLQPGEGIVAEALRVEDGRIAALGDQAGAAASAIPRIDGRGRLLTPGLIDVQTHGIEHVVYEAGPQALVSGIGALGRYGTTTVLPTLYAVLKQERLGELERLATTLGAVKEAHVPGFHLEGPFLALPGAGGRAAPGDVSLLEELIAACGGRVAAMSISPDTPNVVPVIERLREKGIVPFITHTRASVEQTLAAIDAGARHATHFYDVFPVPEETDPGVRPVGAVETILADPRCTVDFIADGVHVHPMAIKAALAAKGYRGVLLCTDCTIGAGLREGIYDTPCGYRVRVTPSGAARVHSPGHANHGTLAGSALTMNAGIGNLLRWLDCPPEQVWAMGTANPARVLSLASRGVMKVGAVADLVLWDEQVRPVCTWVAGECVYREEEGSTA